MRRIVSLIALSALLVGGLTACLGLTEKKFEKKVIKAQCEQYESCSPTEFDAEFESVKDCEEAVAAQSEADLDYYDDCDFVRDEAKDCLKAIENLPCEAEEADYVDFNNSCHNVWVCEGGAVVNDTDGTLPTGTR